MVPLNEFTILCTTRRAVHLGLDLGFFFIVIQLSLCIHFVHLYCVCFRKAIPTGMISGAAAQFLASPMDLVKIQLQTEGKRILEGHKPRY